MNAEHLPIPSVGEKFLSLPGQPKVGGKFSLKGEEGRTACPVAPGLSAE